MKFPGETASGETVMIVSKEITDPSRPAESTVVVDEDGNRYSVDIDSRKLVPLEEEAEGTFAGTFEEQIAQLEELPPAA